MEIILCAATWYKEFPQAHLSPINIDRGLVLCGHRHPHIIYQVLALTGKRSVIPEVGEYTQGFLTSENRFVDRKEGALIAVAANQLLPGVELRGRQLYSEDLY